MPVRFAYAARVDGDRPRSSRTNWALGNLGQRDASGDDLSDMFDYTRAAPVPAISQLSMQRMIRAHRLQSRSRDRTTRTPSTTTSSVREAATVCGSAVLASISWPVPPPGYGPWEQIAFNIADGMRRRGLDVTLFATGELALRRAARRRSSRSGSTKIPRSTARSTPRCTSANSSRARASSILIHNNFDWKPLTYALGSDVAADAHDDPRLFVAADSGGVLRVRRPRSFFCSISDADRDPGPRLSRDGVQRHRSERSSRSTTAPATISSSSGASIPKRARISRSRSRKRAGVRLKMAAIPQDEAYFRELIAAAHRRRSRAVPGRSASATRATNCWRRARARAHDDAAGALRPDDDRSDGLRHAGARRAHGFDSGNRRRRRHRLSLRRRRRRGRAGAAAGVARSPRVPRARRAEFTVERMVDRYLDAYALALALRLPPPPTPKRSKRCGGTTGGTARWRTRRFRRNPRTSDSHERGERDYSRRSLFDKLGVMQTRTSRSSERTTTRSRSA